MTSVPAKPDFGLKSEILILVEGNILIKVPIGLLLGSSGLSRLALGQYNENNVRMTRKENLSF